MPKNLKNSLFSCVSANQEEIAISVPISDSAKKERERSELNSLLSDEKMKELEKNVEDIRTLEKLVNKTSEQIYLLSLKQSILKDYTEKKYLNAPKHFSEMIGICMSIKKKYYKDNNQSILTEAQDPIQNRDKTFKQIELAATQLKPTKKIQQNHPEHTRAPEQGDVQTLSIKRTDLLSIKLKTPKKSECLNEKKAPPSELDKILAKRKEASERNNDNNNQEKLSEGATVEMQLEQKNTDIILSPNQTKNSDGMSFLQQLQAVKLNPISEETQKDIQNENEQSSFANTNYIKATQLLKDSKKPGLKSEDFEILEFEVEEKHSKNQFDSQAFDEFTRKFAELNNEIPAKDPKEQLDEENDLNAPIDPIKSCLPVDKNEADLKSSDQSQNSDASYDTQSSSAEFEKIIMQIEESMESIRQLKDEVQTLEDSNHKTVKPSEKRLSSTVFKISTDADIENKKPVVCALLKRN